MKNVGLKLCSLFVFVGMLASDAFAQAAAVPPQPTFSEIVVKMAPMFLVVFVFFHFFIIRPQKAREQQHGELIKGLKNGDSVVTSSGIIGRVAGVTPQYVTLEVSQGVKIRIETPHVVKREEVTAAK